MRCGRLCAASAGCYRILLAGREEGQQDAGLQRLVEEWAREADVALPPVAQVGQRELTANIHTPDHQGVAAEVDPYPYVDAAALLASHDLIVALDEVQDPHNLGAVIRSAEASGAGVVVTRHRAAGVTAAVVKASAGATEHADVVQVRNLSDFLTQAKGAGFWVYGTAAEAEGDYTLQDYKYPTCFVLGSEGQGISRRVTSLCDVMVSLPLLGRVESLNVSVSAGVLLYEALRQRRAGRQ